MKPPQNVPDGVADFYCRPWHTETAGNPHFPLAGIHWKKNLKRNETATIF
jgi:hypothetical protein